MTPRAERPQGRPLALSITFVMLVAAAASLILAVNTSSAVPRSFWTGTFTEHSGWQTLAYRDAQVDVPRAWTRRDTDACEWTSDGWAPEGSDPCATDTVGVTFAVESTFDPATRPGVISPQADGTVSGYEIAGEAAITATGDEATVRLILDSVRARVSSQS